MQAARSDEHGQSAPPATAAGGAGRRGGMRLTTRITLAASSLTLAFLLVVGTATYYAARAQITRAELNALDNHAALFAGKFGAILNSVVSTLVPLSGNALILNSLMDSLTRDTSLTPFLEDFSTVNGLPVEISLVDFEGIPVAGRGDISSSIEHWRQTVLEDGQPFATVQHDSTGVYLLLAQPIFFARTSTPEGALIHRITLPTSIFGGVEDSEHVQLLQAGTPLMSARGRQATAPRTADLLSSVRALELPSTLKALDLAVEVTADPDMLHAPLGRLLRIYVLAGVLMIGAAFALSALAARRLTRPLRELEAVATAVVASGSFEHRFDASGAAEVSGLADAFNRMMERLGAAYGQLESVAAHESERRRQLAQSNLQLQAEVTDRRRAEDDATRARRLLAQAIENMTGGFALYDEDRRLVLCNETYRAMFPLVSQDLVTGAKFEDIMAKSIERGVLQQVVDADSGEPVERTAAWQGTIPVEMLTREGRWILARDRISDHGILVCVRIDITERKYSEQALAEHAADLARSNAELEQFAYVASHDLKEPLRKVHSFSDLLEMDCASQLDDTGREYLKRIRSSCTRMQGLIDDLLTFSRMSVASDAQGPVDLNEVVAQAVSDLCVGLDESAANVQSGPLPCVFGDPLHMGQLFQNLIGNALKYARPGVTPVVRVQCAWPVAEPHAGNSEPRGTGLQGTLCEISVRDNGIGFEQKYAERIFGVFQRLHGISEYPGTGIGLAICRKIVERHGGTIRAISEPDVGTEIRLTLPIAEPVALREAS